MTDKKVEQFVKKTFRDDPDKGDILTELQELVQSIEPDASCQMKYGGACYFLGDHLCTGFFVYTKHLSVEFGQGYQFKNKHKQLEGNGKYRRHIKLETVEDIEKKNLEYYLEQAFKI